MHGLEGALMNDLPCGYRRSLFYLHSVQSRAEVLMNEFPDNTLRSPSNSFVRRCYTTVLVPIVGDTISTKQGLMRLGSGRGQLSSGELLKPRSALGLELFERRWHVEVEMGFGMRRSHNLQHVETTLGQEWPLALIVARALRSVKRSTLIVVLEPL
jgi:hypothetical protein